MSCFNILFKNNQFGVGIHPQFQDLIMSCHSAYVVDEKLDKDRTVHADIFDSLRMNLQYYNFGDR